ncbi:hypothetical protein [Actinoplanes sp. NPDC020271]|uniref:hypothetical protein n=1 Tax=Actinoplanes sp. NPDC020271 TaxID=3363896 RepID=UPI003788CCAA
MPKRVYTCPASQGGPPAVAPSRAVANFLIALEGQLMSLYPLVPKPGFERYTITVGWNPHQTLFCTVIDFEFDYDAETDSPADYVEIGRSEQILDPGVIVATVEPYAVIPDDLIERLEIDMIEHHVYRRDSANRG